MLYFPKTDCNFCDPISCTALGPIQSEGLAPSGARSDASCEHTNLCSRSRANLTVGKVKNSKSSKLHGVFVIILGF